MPLGAFAALDVFAASVAPVASDAAGAFAAYVAGAAPVVVVACSTSLVFVAVATEAVAVGTWKTSGIVPLEIAVVEVEVQSSVSSSPE